MNNDIPAPEDTGKNDNSSVHSLPEDAMSVIRPHVCLFHTPGPTPFYAVSSAGIREAAAYLGASLREAMVYCLEHGVWPQRFRLNRGFFTAQQQANLLKSHVAVIGCGGLGGHVILLLARLGVGEFTVCDDDGFEESNLNRQLLCREDRMGMNKALAAKEDLEAIASHANVHVRTEAANTQNLPEMVESVHVLVDCLDNLASRRKVEQAARNAGIPYIHGAIGGLEGFAFCRSPHIQDSLLDRLYPGKELPKELRAEYKLGIPTHTAAATAVCQVLLCLSAMEKDCPQTDMLCDLLHLDLSVPEIEILKI